MRRRVLSENRTRRPGVFIDRDGTISEEVGYLNHISRFHMFPFAGSAIRRLNDAGLAVVIVTNQSGVGRGYYPESLVHDVHDLMKQQMSAAGAHVDAVYYCPHTASEACECRKPKTGMLQRGARELSIDLTRSFVVGDRYADVELAHHAGARSVLVRTGYGEGELAWHAETWPLHPDYVAKDLANAADWILGQAK